MILRPRTHITSAESTLTTRMILGSHRSRHLHWSGQATQAQGMLLIQMQHTNPALREPVGNMKWNGKVGTRRITPGGQRRIWQSQKRWWSSIQRKWVGGQRRRVKWHGRWPEQHISFWTVQRCCAGLVVLIWVCCFFVKIPEDDWRTLWFTWTALVMLRCYYAAWVWSCRKLAQ